MVLCCCGAAAVVLLLLLCHVVVLCCGRLVSGRALGPAAERVAVGERVDQLEHVALVWQAVQLLEPRLN